MNIAAWILFGVIAGIIATALNYRRGNALITVFFGVMGALLGGTLATMLFGIGLRSFSISTLVIAGLASLVVLYLNRAIIRS